MKTYLKKIDQNNEINLYPFIKKSEKNNISFDKLKAIFKIEKGIKKNHYLLTIKDSELYHSTFSKFVKNDNDKKVEAALQGNSKTKKSDYALLIWKSNYNDPNSIAIQFFKNRYIFNEKKKKKVVIIENLNNFSRIKSNFSSDINLDEYDFVWGSGNSITNSFFSDFFDEYDTVVCFFDIDLGGLKFYKSLLGRLKKKPIFYFTEEMKNRILLYGRSINVKQYNKVLDLYGNIKELDEVVSFISKHKLFAEQEIFQTYS